MGQEEVYNCLEKKKEPMSLREISIILEMKQETVSAHLKKMIKHNEVSYIELDRIKVRDYCIKNNLPRVKQRMRLYFITK